MGGERRISLFERLPSLEGQRSQGVNCSATCNSLQKLKFVYLRNVSVRSGSNLNQDVVVFEERGKRECKEKKVSRSKQENQQQLHPHMVSTLGFEPGPQRYLASALTSASPLLSNQLTSSVFPQVNCVTSQVGEQRRSKDLPQEYCMKLLYHWYHNSNATSLSHTVVSFLRT